MGKQANRIEQVDEEQRCIDAMYGRLDAEVSTKLSAQERAMAVPVDEPGDLHARDLEVALLAESIRQLRAAEHSLCFGRINHSDQGQFLHIGRIGLHTDDGELLLIDWRAEAARPFYSATMAS